MPDIERVEIMGDAPTDREPSRLGRIRDRWDAVAARRTPGSRAVRVLGAALAAALVVIGVLTVVLVTELRQTGPERAAVAAATAWARAVDTHDLAAMEGSTLPSARVVVVGASGSSERPFRGRQFVSGGRLTFEEGLQLRVVGDPVPADDLHVTMRTQLTCPDGDEATHLTVVTLRTVGDDVRVESVVMTPTPDRSADL